MYPVTCTWKTFVMGAINAIGALGSNISDEARLRSVLCRQV